MTEHAPTAIGGYFGLELPDGKAWHRDAIAVNLERNAPCFLLEAARASCVQTNTMN